MMNTRSELIKLVVYLHFAFESVENLDKVLQPALDVHISERDFVMEHLIKEVRESQRTFIREMTPLLASIRMRFDED